MEHEKNEPQQNRRSRAAKQSTKRKRRGFRIFLKILGTLCLIGVLTVTFFAGIFLTYVETTLLGKAQVDPEALAQELSSIVYYQDKESGSWVELATLKSGKYREEVSLKQMPLYLQEATISIEDERFRSHNGVDWKRTGSAVIHMFLGMENTFGGSTITQQLIKNLTGDKEGTVKRKVTEIVRALEFEGRYSKDEILEMYLNNIFLGNNCYGVQTASQLYFGKDVSELTLAESASLIGITNNPWVYDPLRNENSLANNQKRKAIILGKMLELEKISQAEYDSAMAEKVQFTEDATIEEPEEIIETNYNSYFVDELIREVTADLAVELDISEKAAQNQLYYGGYRIYTTIDPRIQSIAEEVFLDPENNIISRKGQDLHAAITVIEPSTGAVLAMVGDLGEKTGDLVWNWATSTRQCGSSLKPIATYAPALDAGVITPASVIDSAPVRLLNDKAWPRNDNNKYGGLTTLAAGVAKSVNAVAVRVNEALGVNNSFNFLKEKMGITTLVSPEDDLVFNDLNSASLGLGGLTAGVTTEEMAAAYATFVNGGMYNEPHLYTKVTQVRGKGDTEVTIMEKNVETHAAMKETTAYSMCQLLKGVVTGGTGGGARFNGMTVAGKTGTTSDNYDRYFAGFTPYYAAAVWCGYKNNEKIVSDFNPSAALWRKVMSQVHEGLENKDFERPEDMVSVQVCMDSGLLPTDACSIDARGTSRVQTVWVEKGSEPKDPCNLHVQVQYCLDGQCLAGHTCPVESIAMVSVLSYVRETFEVPNEEAPEEMIPVFVEDDPYLLVNLEKAMTEPNAETGIIGCQIHSNSYSSGYPFGGSYAELGYEYDPETGLWYNPESGEFLEEPVIPDTPWIPNEDPQNPSGVQPGGGEDPEEPGDSWWDDLWNSIPEEPPVEE